MFTKHFATELDQCGVSQADLFAYYEAWLRVRYEDLVPPPREARKYQAIGGEIHHLTIQAISKVEGLAADDLENDSWETVHGARFLAHDEITAKVFEDWQWRAEMAGERGGGIKAREQAHQSCALLQH